MSTLPRVTDEAAGDSTSRAGRSVWPKVAVAGLLLGALVYYLWFGLSLRTIDGDDGISILASQGILEFGYPRLPSGYTYRRGFLSHYLNAGAIWLFGTNNLSIMLPHLLFGLGSLYVVYRTAKDILGRSWLGIAAAALLLTLTLQTWYATGPRMYMSLQFFTILAVYAGWRGYIVGESTFKWVTLFALVAATLSNQQGATVALSIPLTILVVRRLRGDAWRAIFSPTNVVTVLLLGVVTLFLATFSPGDPTILVMGHAGVEPNRVGLNLNPIDWGRHVLHLERTVPYSLAFLFVGYLAFFRTLRRRLDRELPWTYLFVAFTLGFIVFGFVVRRGGHRLTLFLIPMYALLVCGGLSAAVSSFAPDADTWLKMPRGRRFVTPALLILGVGASVLLSTLKQTSFRDVRMGNESLGNFVDDSFDRGLSFAGLFQDGYGLPCGYGWRCDQRLQRFLTSLEASMEPGDLIATEIPFVTNFVLDQVDAWLFFPEEDREYPTLQRSPTDEYFGVEIVDSVEELEDLRNTGHRVWLIVHNRDADSSANEEIDRPTWHAMKEMFVKYDENEEFAVYVNRP